MCYNYNMYNMYLIVASNTCTVFDLKDKLSITICTAFLNSVLFPMILKREMFKIVLNSTVSQ